ncbi:uncharacterized protein N7473_001625 [Penicillium subrubescens]|uniref:uncharacterized protein n=1 Tax=Penicillium subrubescens TaxID=1316194 RepID=UPI0025458438|nr:uncharacterized protein N7473_001625 [Penicillium subrubescens]KAJ5904709.1 hypothetical protein N7473_001625 [Penicillium subrubescens]
MAFAQILFIWSLYAFVVVILLAVASVFVHIYQTPPDRYPSVTFTCVIAITSLLGTVLLLPVDVALVSSTTSPNLGRRKDWATQDEIDKITYSLTVVYYLLFSLDALLCLLGIPFAYFWCEEYDECATETSQQMVGWRLWGALKYTMSFVAILTILFLAGLFVPVSRNKEGTDPDYFKKLLAANRGERALTFAIAVLMAIGICLYALYTSSGLALFPISLIKAAPSISNTRLQASAAVQLERNRERQRQLEGRCEGNCDLLSSKDRRELDTLAREERTLLQRQRLGDDAQGEGWNWLTKAWFNIEAVFRPFKFPGGILLLLVTFIAWVSMLLTAIDKAKNSICKNLCGSVVGIAAVGIRFVRVRVFQIRQWHTPPQALLLATEMLMLTILALSYSISMLLAPQYATFGLQTFCDRAPEPPLDQPDCSNNKNSIKPCSGPTDNPAAQQVCTPSIASTFLNRITHNYPFLGAVFFWAQFLFLGLYLVTFLSFLVRSQDLGERQLDEDDEEAEEEGLLPRNGRRFYSTWQ